MPLRGQKWPLPRCHQGHGQLSTDSYVYALNKTQVKIKGHLALLFHFTKVLTKPSLNFGFTSLSNILHATINFSSSYNINQIRWSSVHFVIIDYGKLSTLYRWCNCILVHKCVQQTHLLALHLETKGYIPRLLNALNGLVYFLLLGDLIGDNLW